MNEKSSSPNNSSHSVGEENDLRNLKPSFDKMGVSDNDILAENENIADPNLNDENRFPIEAFPKLLQDLIVECNIALNFPFDYTAVSIISAVSIAVGKSAKLQVKKGWSEYASFYISLVGNAGANKSHPISLAIKPHDDCDYEEIRRFEIENNEFEEYQKLSKKDRADHCKPSKPILKKTILHNFTPEALNQKLKDNERGCAVVSEELATFLEGMNNYSKGDQISVYLSLWSNKGISIDRVGKPVPLLLREPLLNILGSIQPRALPKMFPANKSDNGFLQRFLWAFPTNTQKQPINDTEINEDLIKSYNKWIIDYRIATPIHIDNDSGKIISKIYYWSQDAKLFFYNWQKDNTKKVNDNNCTLKGEILNKYDIHFVRLSLILQIMFDYKSDQISLTAAKAAEKLCNYFQKTSMKVLEILENRNLEDNLPKIKRDFYKALDDTFTTLEANVIGVEFNLSVKAVQRFLVNKTLFTKISHGHYSKM